MGQGSCFCADTDAQDLTVTSARKYVFVRFIIANENRHVAPLPMHLSLKRETLIGCAFGNDIDDSLATDESSTRQCPSDAQNRLKRLFLLTFFSIVNGYGELFVLDENAGEVGQSFFENRNPGTSGRGARGIQRLNPVIADDLRKVNSVQAPSDVSGTATGNHYTRIERC